MIRYMYKPVILSLLLSLFSCSSDATDGAGVDLSQFSVESFNVWVSGKEYVGVIDNDAREIYIGGVASGNNISRVDYKFSTEDVTIYPSPDSVIGDWSESMRFGVTSGSSGIAYTVTLTDYEKPTIKVLDVEVIPSNIKQEILFIGGDMERSQDFMTSSSNPRQVAQLAFGDIDFDICRVAYDKKQELVEGVKTHEECYGETIKAMQYLREVNPDIEFWAVLLSDYNGYNSQNNVPDWIYAWYGWYPATSYNHYFECEKYGIFLTDYLETMEDGGVGIKYMATQKEWHNVISAANAAKIIPVIRSEIASRNVTRLAAGKTEIRVPLFVDAATWSVSEGRSFVNAVKTAGSEQEYYGFSTHNLNSNEQLEYHYEYMVDVVNTITKDRIYHDPARGGLDEVYKVDGCDNIGFYNFADETGGGGHGAVFGSEPDTFVAMMTVYREKCALYFDGIQGELIFEIFSRNGSSENRAVSFAKGGEPYVWKCYYVMKTFVEGLKRTEETGRKWYHSTTVSESIPNIYSMAFIDDHDLFICIVNDGESDIEGATIELVCDTLGETATVTRYDVNSPTTGYVSEEEVTEDNKISFDMISYSVNYIKVAIDK